MQTTGSSNISSLDSNIVADLCTGIFYIDAIPSVYIGGGAANVLGARVRITNPSNIVIKDYPTSTYDIDNDAMDEVVSFNIPTQAGNYQYGNYVIDVKIYDAGGTTWDAVSKIVKLCPPDPKNKTKKYGTLGTSLKGSCKDGKVYVSVNTPPNYNGKIFDSTEAELVLEYPTSSGFDELSTIITSFSTQLFEGVYKLSGNVCVTYNYGDHVHVKVSYKVKIKKEVLCVIDECCVFQQLEELHKKINSDCSQAEKDATASMAVDTLRLLHTAKLAAECGEDASEYILALENLLGCKCSCNCNEGVPIINTNPSKDFVIAGCNTTKSTTGLTDTYTIENYDYVVTVVPNGNALVITSATLADCTKTQLLTFDISVVYAQIKNKANQTPEELFWASVINKVRNDNDATCLGYTTDEWAVLTYQGKDQALLDFICNCCHCEAAIVEAADAKSGANVVLTFTSTNAVSIDIYVDGNFKTNVLSSITTYTLTGYADGISHEYLLIPRCSNGASGVQHSDTFQYLACPHIEPPSVSTNNANNVDCPYNLTALLAALPSGITAEWHTANNTLASTLVGNATAVPSGTYFAFAKDHNGCYSDSVQVQVLCDADISDCTAPQTLSVSTIDSGNLIQFQSAAFPPPSNSYTVKRKLAADADVSGSYTTIGTPSWNSSSNRWEILDGAASVNTAYTYKAISNCGGTSPAILITYANIICPSLTLTPAPTIVNYSFTGVGGGVDKYEVKIYNEHGTELIHTNTHIPTFSNPITGSFIYLSSNTIYKVRTRVYIGTYYKDCDYQTVHTTQEGGVLITNYTAATTLNGTDGITGISGFTFGSGSLPPGSQRSGTHTGFTGGILLHVSATDNVAYANLFRAGLVIDSVDIDSGAVAYAFNSFTYSSTDSIEIVLSDHAL